VLFTPTALYQGMIQNTVTELLPAIATTRIVKEIILCNTTAEPVCCSIARLLMADLEPADKNQLFSTQGLTLRAYETKQITLSLVVEAGERLVATATTTGAVTCNIAGVYQSLVPSPVVDLTLAASITDLQVGQAAKISFMQVSTVAIPVTCVSGLYRLQVLTADPRQAASAVYLVPNGDPQIIGSHAQEAFMVSDIGPLLLTVELSTFPQTKLAVSSGLGLDQTGDKRQINKHWTWDSPTLWSTIGSLIFTQTTTGVVAIHRIL